MRTGSWESGPESADFKDVLVSLPEGSSIVLYGGTGDEESRVAATKGGKGSDIIMHTPLGDYHTLVGSALTPVVDTVRNMTWKEPLPYWAKAGILLTSGTLWVRDPFSNDDDPMFTRLGSGSESVSWESFFSNDTISVVLTDTKIPKNLVEVLESLVVGKFDLLVDGQFVSSYGYEPAYDLDEIDADPDALDYLGDGEWF